MALPPQPGDWRMPEGFAGLGGQALPFLLGGSRLTLRGVEVHVHSVDAGTQGHAHPDYQLLYYMHGSGRQIVGGKRLSVQPQTVLLIPPRAEHAFSPSRGGRADVFAMRFEAEVESPSADDGDNETARLVRFLYDDRPRRFRMGTEGAREAAEWIQRLQDELASQRFGRLLAARGYLLLLLRVFLEAGLVQEKETAPLARDRLISMKAAALVRRSGRADQRLADVAERCHVSPSYVQKVLRRYEGRSFTRLVQEAAVERAARLLRSTDLAVKEIASEVGTTDANYFARLFRRIEGISPTEYRGVSSS